MIKFCMILLSAIFCGNAFAQDFNDEEWSQNFPAEFISKYSKASEYCSSIGKKRHKLDNKSLKILSMLQKDQLGKYLIYKNELSMNRCIEDNGGYPVIFLINYMSGKKITQTNKEIVSIAFKLISSSPFALASVNFDKNMSDKKKKELKSIKYLDAPFDIVKISEQIINQMRKNQPIKNKASNS